MSGADARRLLFTHTGERWRVQITLDRPDGPRPFALWSVETRDDQGRWIDVVDNGDLWIEDPWRRHPAEPSLFVCGLGITASQTGTLVAVAQRATGEPALLRATTTTGMEEHRVLRVEGGWS